MSVPEYCGCKMIPQCMDKSGHMYTVSITKSGKIGSYKIETSSKYFRRNSKNISSDNIDYMMRVQEIR
ncbi:MAG: hypothetical protein ACRCXA_05220 [Peptostreptococcaceae bacterium]